MENDTILPLRGRMRNDWSSGTSILSRVTKEDAMTRSRYIVGVVLTLLVTGVLLSSLLTGGVTASVAAILFLSLISLTAAIWSGNTSNTATKRLKELQGDTGWQWKAAVFTTFATGVLMILVVYVTAFLITAALRIETISLLEHILFEIMQRIQIVTGISPVWFAAFYTASMLAVGTGFWLLYPYTPIRSGCVATGMTFGISLLVVMLIGNILAPAFYTATRVGTGLDAIYLLIWIRFYAQLYPRVAQDIEKRQRE